MYHQIIVREESLEILNLKTALWPSSRRQFRGGGLKMAHIYGAAPFPSPKPYGGGLRGISHISLP